MARQTRQRQAVLTVLEQAADPPTAAAIFERVRERLPGVGFATIYRVLGSLAREGRVQAIQVGSTTQYDRRTDRHDHLVCRGCGKLVDVVVALPPELLDHTARQHGFALLEYRTELHGFCPACRGTTDDRMT